MEFPILPSLDMTRMAGVYSFAELSPLVVISTAKCSPSLDHIAPANVEVSPFGKTPSHSLYFHNSFSFSKSKNTSSNSSFTYNALVKSAEMEKPLLNLFCFILAEKSDSDFQSPSY